MRPPSCCPVTTIDFSKNSSIAGRSVRWSQTSWPLRKTSWPKLKSDWNSIGTSLTRWTPSGRTWSRTSSPCPTWPNFQTWREALHHFLQPEICSPWSETRPYLIFLWNRPHSKSVFVFCSLHVHGSWKFHLYLSSSVLKSHWCVSRIVKVDNSEPLISSEMLPMCHNFRLQIRHVTLKQKLLGFVLFESYACYDLRCPNDFLAWKKSTKNAANKGLFFAISSFGFLSVCCYGIN